MCDTPMMKQYKRIKAKHKSAILFFRMGDFYEMFFEDAKIASKILGIALTSRSKGPNAAPMAGVPVKAVDTYVQKLLNKGYKVAICEQIEDASQSQGLVDRDVVRIITPGTLTEQEVLPEKENNYLLSINIGKKKVGLCWADISTGEFIVHEIDLKDLLDEITRINPVECLIPEGKKDFKIKTYDQEITLEKLLESLNIHITYRPNWFFNNNNGEKLLLEHFKVKTLEGFGTHELKDALGAAGSLLTYLKETQKTELNSLDKIEIYNAGETMHLDWTTRTSLEILKTLRKEEKEGTLIYVLDKTCTSMGGRLLVKWLSAPLINIQKIKERQEAIKELIKNREVLEKIRETLSFIQDIERLCSRIAYQRATARDLLILKNSLKNIPILYEILKNFSSPLINSLKQKLNSLEHITDLLERAIHNEAKSTLKEGGIIKDGFNKDLDELRKLQNSADNWLKEFQRKEIERTGIPSLKVGYNKVFGYYIEVTKTYNHKIPKEYNRKQTLKNAERYTTFELKEYEEKILSASEKAKILEYELFIQVRDEVAKSLHLIRETANSIAWIDVLCSLAKVSIENDYVCPEIDDTKDLEIYEGRHPVLEVTLNEPFVPNDVVMGEDNKIAIITGPNMAGKSTYIRQTALLILMAQIGSFIPAKKARIGIVDRIFTRIGASDEIAKGRSTFMVEMVETANILNNATDRSFIALDEIGRGTSTFDGISLAWAIVEYIQKNIKARTLFATHYHEISELAEIYSDVNNFNVSIKEWGEEIIFLYKIIPGAADKSYGIHVAKLAGIPKEVIKRSTQILNNLEKHALDFQVYTKKCCKINNNIENNLFSLVGEDIIDTLANLDINNLTPLQAFEILKDLHSEAKNI